MKTDRAVLWKERLSRINVWDAAAVVLLATFAVYHVFLARIGFQNPDEAFYLTIPHRVLLGDSLITDEWHLSQFSSFFQLLPFWLFHKVTGGTEGIILYSRYVFVAVQTVFGAFLYKELRAYKWASLVSLFFYLRLLPYFTMALNYFTLSYIFVIYLGLRLFVHPAQTRPRKVLCGAVYACLVLVEPLTVLLYPLYTLLVLVKGRKRARQPQAGETAPVCWSGSFWIWATVGILICFVLFLIFLFSRATLHDVLQAIPKMAQDTEYPLDKGAWDVFTRFLKRDYRDYLSVLNATGHAWILLTLAVVVIAAIAVSRFTRCDLRHPALVCASILLVWTLCLTVLSWPDALYFPIDWQFAAFGLVCYLLTEHKQKDLFSFYLFGTLFALLVNSSSECDVGLGMLIPALISPQLCFVFLHELAPTPMPPRSRPREACRIGSIRLYLFRKRVACALRSLCDVEHKRYRLEQCLIFVCIGAVICTQLLLIGRECRGDCFFDGGFFTQEKTVFSETLERGPYRGIKATPERAQLYADILSDLDRLQAQTDEGDTVYIANLLEWGYLYLDVSVYTPYTTYYVIPDMERRQYPYWDIHPEKIPDVIYLLDVYEPTYGSDTETTEQTLHSLQTHFVCQTEQAECGYILHVTGLQ